MPVHHKTVNEAGPNPLLKRCLQPPPLRLFDYARVFYPAVAGR